MSIPTFLALIPALAGLMTIQSDSPGTIRMRVVQGEIILRVPIRPRPGAPAIRWEERKGPKCVPIAQLRAATLSGPDQIDFLLKDRRRVRAELSEGCPALDFYGGFYLKSEDEAVCADRDSIRSRMGGSCEIDRFRLLVPKRDD